VTAMALCDTTEIILRTCCSKLEDEGSSSRWGADS